MSVQIAPSRRALAVRSFMLLGAAGLVFGAMYWAKGAPAIQRRARWDELALFAPRIGEGIADLLLQVLLVVLLAWAFRDKLKVRL